MDTPKRADSFLESFPPDIWAYFAWYIPGEQLGRLMMTGATLLWQRLKSPNVVKSISLGNDFVVFKSFPRFLDDFPSLEELSIHSFNHARSGQLGLTIDTIPSGIRALELTGEWVLCFQMFGEGGTLELNEHLPHLEVLDLRDIIFTNYSWMTHSPKSLTELEVNSWDGTVELPSCLLHFTVDNVYLSRSSFVSKLPASLYSFHVVNSFVGVDLVVPILPPSIRQLSLGYETEDSDCPRPSQNFLEQLPKSLTQLMVTESAQVNFEKYPEFISLLPSTLTELVLRACLPWSVWSLLPPRLEKLTFLAPASQCTIVSKSVHKQGRTHTVRTFPFDLLPRSITSLKLLRSFEEQYCGPPSTSNESYFPPKLTSLVIQDIQLSPEAAKLLPSSLIHLETGNLSERVCEQLPRGLTKLNSRRTLLSPTLFKFLPKSLISLHLSLCLAKDEWFDYETGGRTGSVLELPEYSIQTHFLSSSYDWKNASLLPPKLTELGIILADGLGDSFLLHQQLPNLTQLRLKNAKHLSDLSIPLISPHITSLNFSASSNISGKSFQSLPRCLTYLNLSEAEPIFDSDIQHLPRTLITMNLSKAIHLTELCIPELPPHLESLVMRHNKKITPWSYPYLPYSLRSSQTDESVELLEWRIDRGEIILKSPRMKHDDRCFLI